MEPPSGITYKDQGRLLEELRNGGSQPSRGAEPPSSITYKDQALSLEELQARNGGGSGRQTTRPSATDDDDDIILVVQATPIPMGDAPPPPPQFPPHYPPTLGAGNESAKSAISRRWKWWILGGVILVVLAAGVVAGVAFADDSATSPEGEDIGEGGSPTNAPGPADTVPPLQAATSWIAKGNRIEGSAASDSMGFAVALSADARFLAVVADHLNSGAVGYVRVFQLDGDTWVQVGVDIVGETENSFFGDSLDISDDGIILAVGGGGFNAAGGNNTGRCCCPNTAVIASLMVGSLCCLLYRRPCPSFSKKR